MKPLRLFTAIELPAAITEQLAPTIAALKTTVSPKLIRWVRANGIHLTLKFFGDVAPERLAVLEQVLHSAVTTSPAFSLDVGGLGVFPHISRPRVIWVGLSGDLNQLRDLQAAIETACAPLGFPPEARAFTPHLTLGRFNLVPPPPDRERLTAAFHDKRYTHLGTFHADHLALIQSDLQPTGAVYTRRWAAPLGSTPKP